MEIYIIFLQGTQTINPKIKSSGQIGTIGEQVIGSYPGVK